MVSTNSRFAWQNATAMYIHPWIEDGHGRAA